MSDYRTTTIDVGPVGLAVLQGGTGAPLLVLHDELGFPGWMRWNRVLAETRELIVPLQPGFGQTPRVEWLRNYRDVAAFYSRFVRERGIAPVDIVGFSAGGFIAAEMVAAAPELVRRLVLVAPMGVRPCEGEIFDFLAVTMRRHVAMTISRHDAEECALIYGGGEGMSSEQFELFEAARAETSRLGWEPFMFDATLPERLAGIGTGVEALLVWGDADQVVPRGCIDVYERSIPNTRVAVVNGVGHRPEIEDPATFIQLVSGFLAD